jgi:hypothetical protein
MQAVLVSARGEAASCVVKVPRARKAQTNLTVDGVGSFGYVCSNDAAHLSFYELSGAVSSPSDLLSKSVSLPFTLCSYLFGSPVLVVTNGGALGVVAPLPLTTWKSVCQAHAASSAVASKRMHFVNGGHAHPKFALQLNPLTKAVVVTRGTAKDVSKDGRKKGARTKKTQAKKSRVSKGGEGSDDDQEEIDEDEDEEEASADDDEEVLEEEVLEEEEENQDEDEGDDCDNDEDEAEDEDDDLDDNFEEEEKDNNIDAEDGFCHPASGTEQLTCNSSDGRAKLCTARQTRFMK